MGSAPNWTAEQTSYLQENWGMVCVSTIAKNLGRTECAIAQKALKLGLGAFLESGDYVTLNQLLIATTGSEKSYGYKTTSWVKKRGLPVHNRRVKNCTFRVVYLDEFWKWARSNRDFLDLSKMQENALGAEPDWVKEQRRLHYRHNSKYSTSPWSKLEDSRLISLLKQHRYTYLQLSQMLGRTSGAIQRRCNDLGLSERPVKADNHVMWSDDELAELAFSIGKGMGYELIAEVIGRSSKAVRGKVFSVYLTENLDKVRAMIAGGKWGEGAPAPTVNQAKRKGSVKDDLAKLAGLLALRRNELGWSTYWQKDMCMHWHEMKGCTMEQENCDVCSEFRRIPPQNCVRCGCTFFEREKNRVCTPCRQARLKQARRKWARTQDCHGSEKSKYDMDLSGLD